MTKTEFKKKLNGEKLPEKKPKNNENTLLFTLTTSLILSEDKSVNNYLDMTIKEFCKSDTDLYSWILCFVDDYRSFTGRKSAFPDIRTLAEVASEIVISVEKYTDFDVTFSYQAYLDTDGMSGTPVDTSQKLIEDAKYILYKILYLPYGHYAG